MPCIVADDLTPEQIKAFRVADNKTSELAEWDFDKLEIELESLKNIDMTVFGFDFDEAEQDIAKTYDDKKEKLQDRFLIPPFSILDTRQGYWQDRKRIWKSILKSQNGRDDGLLGDGLNKLADIQGGNLTGTSVFDPVLCEILINWFCPANSRILDPFAGGSVRGLISVLLGHEYTGVDLSEKQIKANYKNYKAIADRQDLFNNDLKKPNWIVGDSANIDLLATGNFDFFLTCPPYADLEVYSDNPNDLSNMPYAEFKTAYFDIIKKACDKLKGNSFAVIIVGDVRGKNGYYYGFVNDTIQAFKSAGLQFYNDCVLVEQIATAALRAGRQFDAKRKVVKTHQNVLVFVKGDESEIMKKLNKYEYDFDMLNLEQAESEL